MQSLIWFFVDSLFSFSKNATLLKELKRILKKKIPLIISAQNRDLQSLSSLSGKQSLDNAKRAFSVLVSEEHECITKDGRVKIYTWPPHEVRTMLERNGLCLERIVGKMATMPLRIRQKFFLDSGHPEDLFNDILQF
jgi:hypothetical protein